MRSIPIKDLKLFDQLKGNFYLESYRLLTLVLNVYPVLNPLFVHMNSHLINPLIDPVITPFMEFKYYLKLCLIFIVFNLEYKYCV